MITVGLTGGIACGKSTVAAMLRERGVPVLDLDQVGRDIVAPGSEALREIGRRWPTAVIDGVLDRRALGAIVMKDAAARRELEAMTHPRIWARMEDWLAETARNGAPAAVVEAALMVETSSYRRYDKLIVVSCSRDVQSARLAAREGFDAATVERWINAQMPMAEKEKAATVVIRNDSDREALRQRVDVAWGQLLPAD
ncbi:MAG: dephospho-CoA kinase [Deltaproteobacteria bacterium]|nr:dephospho-CoA kinase [Deltaproteobacteria bacterium]